MGNGYTVTFEVNRASASLVVWHDEKTAELELISSKYRRRGNAKAVLQKALDYADFFNLEVVLEVQPFGDGVGMRKEDLRAWYMEFGFLSEGNDVMARKPIHDRPLSEEDDREANDTTSTGDGPRLVRNPLGNGPGTS